MVQNVLLADGLAKLCGLPGHHSPLCKMGWLVQWKWLYRVGPGGWAERLHQTAKIPMRARDGCDQQLASEYCSKHHTRITLKIMVWLETKSNTNFYYFQHFVMKNLKQCSHLFATYILQLFHGVVSLPLVCVSVLFSGAFQSELWVSVLYSLPFPSPPPTIWQEANEVRRSLPLAHCLRAYSLSCWWKNSSGLFCGGWNMRQSHCVEVRRQREFRKEVGPDHNP